MQLTTYDILYGLAGTNDAITYTIFGRSTGSNFDAQILAQGTLTQSKKILYYARSNKTITAIQLANTTGAAVPYVTFYLNTVQVAGAFTIAAYGTLSYANETWDGNDNSGSHIVGVNLSKITVSVTPPVDPVENDIWLALP